MRTILVKILLLPVAYKQIQ